MGLRGRLRRIEREAEQELVTVRLEDGTLVRFRDDEIYPECFMYEHERGRRHFEGEEPGPAHPFLKALRNAADGEVERLVPEHGTMILHWLGEDEVIRGERERPGPSVRETSPGVYE